MCEFSNSAKKRRKAKKGDALVTDRFGGLTAGLCAIADAGKGKEATAVCLLPGTQLALKEPVRVDYGDRMTNFVLWLGRALGLSAPLPTATTAVFTQVDLHDEETHHDALEFPQGGTVKLADMEPGQYVNVLQLPVTLAKRGKRAKHTQRQMAEVD